MNAHVILDGTAKFWASAAISTKGGKAARDEQESAKMTRCPNDNLFIDIDRFENEPAEEYHARAGEYLTSHQLLDFMKSPWLHRKKSLGLIEDRDSPAYLIGRAAHVRILEGRDEYQQRFALGGPVNPNTGKPYGSNTKAYAKWQREQGKPAISHDKLELIEQMASGVAMNAHAVDLFLYGRPECVIRTDYCGLPCQVRIDWVHPHRGIVDLKTCDDLTWFESDARRYRYVHQMAFYRAVLAAAIGGGPVPVHIVAVEKKEPYRCGIWIIGDDALSVAQKENEAAIGRLVRCRQEDHWPSGYEEVRTLGLA